MMIGPGSDSFDVATFVSELSSSSTAGFPAPASMADVHRHFASSYTAVSAHPPSSDIDILSSPSAPKIPPRAPKKSAWSRGTPQTSTSSASPPSQSPAPSQKASQLPIKQSYSRRPDQGVSIKDGVSVPRRNVGAANAKQGSAVTFGYVDDAAVPISSSPASAPPVRSEGLKSYGSIPVTNSSLVNDKASPSFGLSFLERPSPSTSSSRVASKGPRRLVSNPASASLPSSLSPAPSTTPTPKLTKTDIRKLFVTAPPSSTPSTTSGFLGPSGAAGRTHLNTDAKAFVPKRITIKNQDGREVDLENWRNWKRTPSSLTSQKRTSVVRIETVEARKKRLAEQEKDRAKKAADKEAGYFLEEGKRRKEEEKERTRRGERVCARTEEEANFDVRTSSNVFPQGIVATRAAAAEIEPVQPLATPRRRNVPAVDHDSPEIVEQKVKTLLDKLTMRKFDFISDQIINLANKSENEKDGRTLVQIINLVFEKASDEVARSEMYARLCRKMMERISPNVQDDGIRNSEGQPIAGSQLFRKYLLNRCQDDFERGWAAKDAAASAAAAKASEDEAAKKAAETTGEAELYSEEYYTAQTAKRQGLGLIQFIGELYKLQMLTERIMHECIKKLLGNVDNPEEEEIESLCGLLTAVGQLLDHVMARAHMDLYFSRMKGLIKSNNVSSRMQFLLQDLIELRERKWVPRDQVAAPATIAQIHEAVTRERVAHETSIRTLNVPRSGSKRGSNRGASGEQMQGADGWSVASVGQPRPRPKAGDLSNFGKINKTAPMTFGPSSVFVGKKENTKRDSALSRTTLSSNMFSMLNEDEKPTTAGSAVKPSRPSSRRTSVDLGQSGVPVPPAQRRKLQLLPRTKPVEETKANEEESDVEENAPLMSEEEAEKKIVEDIKEFFGIRNIEESEDYFSKLPSEYRHRLVDKMVTKAIESKEADAQLVADTFRRAVEKNLCSLESFQEGFIPTAEILDDIAIDAPRAFGLMAIMMIGAGLDKDEERYSRIADKLEDKDQLLSHFT